MTRAIILRAGHPQVMLTEIYIEALLFMRNWLTRFGRLGIRGRLVISGRLGLGGRLLKISWNGGYAPESGPSDFLNVSDTT